MLYQYHLCQSFIFNHNIINDCIGIVIFAMILMGFFFKLFCCVLWPIVAMLVKELKDITVGTAYSLTFASKNWVIDLIILFYSLFLK